MNRTPDTIGADADCREHRARTHRHVRRTAALAVALAALTVASTGSATAEPVSVLAIASSLEEVIDNARNWLVGISSAVATICLTIAGVRYVIASGDPAEVEKSKSALRAACLGYALAMLAPVIVVVLKSIVGA